jgi:hypothetical protein
MRALDKPTPAETALEASLVALRDAVARVPRSHAEALAHVEAALADLDRATAGEDGPGFVTALLGLARAIKDARASPDGGALKELPVPPYDLWLPFKAASQRPAAVISAPGTGIADALASLRAQLKDLGQLK